MKVVSNNLALRHFFSNAIFQTIPDTVTENSVQEALNLLGSDRTCLVIAHRLGTVRNADKIIVLNDGLVAEEGTHEELLAKEGGRYRAMWEMQLHSTSSERGSTANLKDLDS